MISLLPTRTAVDLIMRILDHRPLLGLLDCLTVVCCDLGGVQQGSSGAPNPNGGLIKIKGADHSLV